VIGQVQASSKENSQVTSVLNRRDTLKGISALEHGTSFVGLGQAKPTGNDDNSGHGANEVPIGSQLATYGFGEYSVSELIYEHDKANYDVFEPFFLDDKEAIGDTMEASRCRRHTCVDSRTTSREQSKRIPSSALGLSFCRAVAAGAVKNRLSNGQKCQLNG